MLASARPGAIAMPSVGNSLTVGDRITRPRNTNAASTAGIATGAVTRENPSLRQRNSGPTVITAIIGSTKIAATGLKYGGPTETLVPIASVSNGYSVPISTIPKIAVSITLLNTSAPSRLTGAKRSPSVTVEARKPNSASAPPI